MRILLFLIFIILGITCFCQDKPERRYIGKNPLPGHMFASFFTGTEELNKILSKGVSEIPFVMKKMKEKKSFFLIHVEELTKKAFEFPNGVPGDKIKCEMYYNWWKNGRIGTYVEFDKVINKLKQSNQIDLSKKVKYRHNYSIQTLTQKESYLSKIERMGLDILPKLIEEYIGGYKEFNNIIKELTNMVFDTKCSSEKAKLWWLDNRRKFTIEDEKILEIKNYATSLRKAVEWIELLESDQEIYYQNAEIGLEDLPETEEIVNYLIGQLQNNKNSQVRKSVALTLGRRNFNNQALRVKVKHALTKALEDSKGEVRAEVVFALGEMADKDIVPLLKKKYESDKYSKEIDSFDGEKYVKKTIYPVKIEIERVFKRWGEKVTE